MEKRWGNSRDLFFSISGRQGNSRDMNFRLDSSKEARKLERRVLGCLREVRKLERHVHQSWGCSINDWSSMLDITERGGQWHGYTCICMRAEARELEVCVMYAMVWRSRGRYTWNNLESTWDILGYLFDGWDIPTIWKGKVTHPEVTHPKVKFVVC